MKLPKLNKWQITALVITVVIIIVVIVIVLNRKKKQREKFGTMSETDYTNFYDELVKYTQKHEGGLSNDTSDSAAKNPSPTPQKYHTNKGVTWTTFTNSAKELGYDPSLANFLEMPNEIWLKIFDKKYIARARKISENPVLSSYIGMWYWGGWYKGHVSTEQVAAIIADAEKSDKQKLRELVDLRKVYFDKVIAAIPRNAKFEKGWKNRAENYYTLFNKYLS